MKNVIVSICIPSFNRTTRLEKLLNSIDCNVNDVEIVISEDFSPNRNLIRQIVTDYSKKSKYNLVYNENDKNLGFDGNLRKLIEISSGDYVLFMGDDDLFIPNALDTYINFLKENSCYSYVLRTYKTIHNNGLIEDFKYLANRKVLEPGINSIVWLFKRSVTITGFTINRKAALRFSTVELDGTLLYQVYLMCQVCLLNHSIYCEIPFAYAVQTFREDSPFFGNSDAEKIKYKPGVVWEDNSINFAKSYFEVTDYIEKCNNLILTKYVRNEISKYSYPFLSIQRKRGVKSFLVYSNRLKHEVGIGNTFFFYIYKWALVILGEQLCDRIILFIKKINKSTPNF